MLLVQAGGIRSGELSLRQQRMTLPMLDAMRIEPARVDMSLVSRNGSEESSVARRNGKCQPQAYEYIYVRIRVKNQSCKFYSLPHYSDLTCLLVSPMTLIVDISAEPTECVLIEGSTSDIPVGRLESGEAHEVELPICFIAYGQFELSAEVRVLDNRQRRTIVGSSQLKVVVESG